MTSSVTRRLSTLAAANLLGFVFALGVVTLAPGVAAAIWITRHLEDATGRPLDAALRHFKLSFRRDWWVGLIAWIVFMVCGSAILLTTAVSSPALMVLLLGIEALLYGAAGAVLATYVHSAGSISPLAPRYEVIALAGARLGSSPSAWIATGALVLVMIPVWVIVPIALSCGITLPAWLLTRLHARVDSDMLELAPMTSKEMDELS